LKETAEKLSRYYVGGREIRLGEKIGSGGEGTVYGLGDGHCVKIYAPGRLSGRAAEKLRHLTRRELPVPGVCRPLELVFDQRGDVAGCVMERARGLKLQTSLFLPHRKFPRWDRRDLCDLCLTILERFQGLHDQGVLMGDVNPGNFMVESPSSVFFVDVDSYQTEGHPCPVGYDQFTPPELQGKPFGELMRQPAHEHFSVAVLLFMIFMLGRHPYSRKGGGAPAENIRKGTFPYPYGVEFDYEVPEGGWEQRWVALSDGVKRAFHDCFARGARLSLSRWAEIVGEYRRELESGDLCRDLEPRTWERLVKDRALRIDDGRRAGEGTGENPLNPSGPLRKVAVLELSTRAVKLMCGDLQALAGEFRWGKPYFVNESDLTHTGGLMDKERKIDPEAFRRSVLPSIRRKLRRARELGADRLHCIATAVFRGAANRSEILDLVRKETGLSVRVLTKAEEASFTVDAFFWSTPGVAAHLEGAGILVDQGGGSTEVSVFDSQRRIRGSCNISIGTTNGAHALFVNASPGDSVAFALSEARKWMRHDINRRIRETRLDSLGPFSLAMGVGSAITRATGRKGNRSQHGVLMSRADLEHRMGEAEERLTWAFPTLRDLALHAGGSPPAGRRGRGRHRYEEDLVELLGLSMYLHLMDRLGLEGVVVNGTGLRYGYFWNNIN